LSIPCSKSLELGHRRIAKKIGAGGMGEAGRARDEHLSRDDAIKVLPAVRSAMHLPANNSAKEF
jgi:hypothetical protein